MQSIFGAQSGASICFTVWNGSVRVGTEDLSRPCLNTFVKPPLSARLTVPGSPRMNTLIFSECTYIQMLSVMGLGFAILFLSIFRHSYPVPRSLFSKKKRLLQLKNLPWTMSHKIILSSATHKMSSVHVVRSIAFCLASNAD